MPSLAAHLGRLDVGRKRRGGRRFPGSTQSLGWAGEVKAEKAVTSPALIPEGTTCAHPWIFPAGRLHRAGHGFLPFLFFSWDISLFTPLVPPLSLGDIIFLCFAFFFFSPRAAPVAHRSSQASGRIGATAAGLHHSHSNVGSEPRLRPTLQVMAMLDP